MFQFEKSNCERIQQSKRKQNQIDEYLMSDVGKKDKDVQEYSNRKIKTINFESRITNKP